MTSRDELRLRARARIAQRNGEDFYFALPQKSIADELRKADQKHRERVEGWGLVGSFAALFLFMAIATIF